MYIVRQAKSINGIGSMTVHDLKYICGLFCYGNIIIKALFSPCHALTDSDTVDATLSNARALTFETVQKVGEILITSMSKFCKVLAQTAFFTVGTVIQCTHINYIP